MTSYQEGFDSCLELGGGWRKCNDPWETCELRPACVTWGRGGGGGGGRGMGNCLSARSAKQCLSVLSCGLNITAEDKVKTRGGGVLGRCHSCHLCLHE